MTIKCELCYKQLSTICELDEHLQLVHGLSIEETEQYGFDHGLYLYPHIQNSQEEAE